MDYEIVRMQSEHIDGIVEIENSCFVHPWTYDGIKEELSNPQSHFLVALCDGKVVGYIGVQEICFEAYITNIAVLADYRCNGIGGALLQAAVTGAKERNCSMITLEVRTSNQRAVTLYEKMRFKNVGKRRNFYTNPTEDAYIYTLFLSEV